MVVEVVLSAEGVVVAWETEAGRAVVVVQALQPRVALEQRHPEEGARSRQCSGVGSLTNRADRGGRLGHQH